MKRRHASTTWRIDVAEQLRNRGHEKESVEWMKCGDPAFIRSIKTCSNDPEHFNRAIGCSCHLRICPECGHRDGARLLKQYFHPIRDAAEHAPNGWSLKHLVLTSHYSLWADDIEDQYRAIYKHADQLFEEFFGKDWQKSERGLIYSTEFGEDGLKLHLHVLILCEYLPQAVLSARWAAITGDQILYIRCVYNVRKAVAEMVKYVTKLSIQSPADVVRIFEVIKGSRRIRSRGIFYNLPKYIAPKITNCKHCGAPIIQMFPADFDAWKASFQIEPVEDADLLHSIIGNKSGVPPPDRKHVHVETVDLTEYMWSEYQKKHGNHNQRESSK